MTMVIGNNTNLNFLGLKNNMPTMFILLTIFALADRSCPWPVVENKTSVWNEQDQWTFDRAMKRCGQIYSDAPCLKKFVKKDPDAYNAICGAK